MFEITDQLLESKSNYVFIKRGEKYFNEKRIKSIQFNQDTFTFDATVIGTEKYNVRVNFTKDGEFHRATCNCDAFGSYWNTLCKHIVAVLMMVRERDEQGFFDELQFRHVAKQIFKFFQEGTSSAKMPVQLEYNLSYNLENSYNSGTHTALSLKIGHGRLYVIRNLKEFMSRLEKGQEMEFGKGFTFDPNRYEFSQKDKKIIDFIKEAYQSQKLIDRYHYNSPGKGGLMKDKLLYLSDSALKRFFEISSEISFNIAIENTTTNNVKICQKELPIGFSLDRSNNDLILDIDCPKTILPLTEEGEYFFADDKIYKIPEAQAKCFKPFYMAMLYQKGNKIKFLEEDREKFISEVLPFAEKAGKLEITENVMSMVDKPELSAEVYLDRAGYGITAELKYNYGERIINPFGPQEKFIEKEKIMIRDVQKERLVADLLGLQPFKVNGGAIYLNEEDKIFDFIYEVLPRLQEQADVYYSEEFRKIATSVSRSYTGGVRLNDSDLLEFTFSIDGVDKSELRSIFDSIKQKKKYFRLRDGAYLNLEDKELTAVSDMVNAMGLSGKDLENEQILLPKYRALYLDKKAKDEGLTFFERNHAFREFSENIKEPADMDFEVPLTLKPILRDYQKIGFKWLKTLSSYALGGILADDMGLGKTLQVIALILSDKHEKGTAPSLVVAPTSLVYNWCAEVEKFAPELKVIAVSGTKNERRIQMEEMALCDIVVTSYPLIRRDVEDYNNIKFRYCILDEAQHIKNPSSQNAKAVKSVNSERRFALTGTPVENSLTELWSIFDYVMPGYLFGHSVFMQKYEIPIARDQSEKELCELSFQIKPFILRRLKIDVLKELPEKIENKLVAELTDQQKAIYMAWLEQIKGDIEKEISENGFEKSQIKILSGLTRLRQICCHPGMFVDNYTGDSGKFLMLQEVLQEAIEGGHRILLFSQFTSMLAIIRNWLDSEKISYLYLDGSTPASERGNLVKSFNNGKGEVFLISLKAGGVGLNLTGADTVIHYDPWWNPAVEDQATDRAYRIGQKKRVLVMKLVTRGTIEEKIVKLQEKKKELIDAIIKPGENMINKLTVDEVRALFEV